jgi:hypothetical protein
MATAGPAARAARCTTAAAAAGGPSTTASALDVESLHATWIDPDGGVWAVGGDVVTAGLDNGAIVYRGVPTIPRYAATAPPPPPAPSCPAAEIDPAPSGSIARRWNEQILGAIRRDLPRPGVHARNLFHLAVALWDAWATYDATADGYVSTTRVAPPADLAAARQEALSYAAYRVLSHRYGARSAARSARRASTRSWPSSATRSPTRPPTGDGPRAVGNRIGAAVIAAFADDGANEQRQLRRHHGLDVGQPAAGGRSPGHGVRRPVGVPAAQPRRGGDPERHRPAIGRAGLHRRQLARGHAVRAAPHGRGAPYFDWGPPPRWDQPEMKAWVTQVIRRTAELDHADGATIDISPGRYGNNPLGTDDGTGHPLNPSTGQPYPANVVPRGDFARVLAEFWADGREVRDPARPLERARQPGLRQRRLRPPARRRRPELDPLAWDVHLYLALDGAVHDAAIAAWELKRVQLAARPITLIRYMAGRGQSSDPGAPSYDPGGLPLVPGLIELITPASAAPGQRHAHLARHVGKVAVRSWRGEPGARATEVGGVGWIRAIDWIPYQRRTFVTPAFPGYISGHSTFSRAAAEVLAAITGSPYFPGGPRHVHRAGGWLPGVRGRPVGRRPAAVGHVLRRRRSGRAVPDLRRHPHPARRPRRPPHRPRRRRRGLRARRPATGTAARRRSSGVGAVAEQPAELAGRAAGAELAERVEVVQQERAVVADRQVLQLERADAVLGREGRLEDPLHRQLVGRVGHVVGAGVEQRVVVAAAQLDGDRAGDRRRDPAGQAVLEQARLGVVPAALVQAADRGGGPGSRTGRSCSRCGSPTAGARSRGGAAPCPAPRSSRGSWRR